MKYEEYIKEALVLHNTANDLKLRYVYSKTRLRIGDTVKFIEKGDSYLNEKNVKRIEKIYDFEIYSNGSVVAKCTNHQTIDIRDCTKIKLQAE